MNYQKKAEYDARRYGNIDRALKSNKNIDTSVKNRLEKTKIRLLEEFGAGNGDPWFDHADEMEVRYDR